MLSEALQKFELGESLTEYEAMACLAEMFEGHVPENLVVEFLAALTQKGESIEEILGFVRHLTSRCVSVGGMQNAVDTCGTGGSGMDRFNIGTTVAFILAAGGYPVAKHGNLGSKRPNGSFDLLRELGVSYDHSPEQIEEIFNRTGLCFLFARMHHPMMKIVSSARAKMEQRSIFNLIGPLCNPANVDYQVVGISNHLLGEKLIQVLKYLGRRRAIVVYGTPGIDEFSVSGESIYWFLNEKGEVSKHHIDPSIIGIPLRAYGEVPGGDAQVNKELFDRVLRGEECQGLLDMVALNAGAAIFVLGKCVNISEGYSTAKELILSGETRTFFEYYKSVSNQYI